MRTIINFVLLIIILVLGFFAYQYLIPTLRPPKGFLKIETSPEAEVLLDGRSLGKTPLQQKNLKVGAYNLTLRANLNTLPKAPGATASAQAVEFKQKIDLQPSAVTFVKYEFAPQVSFSSGEILGLREGAGISVVTNTDGAEISLDGTSIGNSPLSQIVEPGVHTLKVSKDGYLTREVEVNIEEEFRLAAWVSLALDPYPQTKQISKKGKYTLVDLSTNNLNLSSDLEAWAGAVWFFQTNGREVPEKFDLLIDQNGKSYVFSKNYSRQKEINVGYLSSNPGKLTGEATSAWNKLVGVEVKAQVSKIEILSTPNGFLNVRSGPGTNFSIVSKVNPGQTLSLIEEKGAWFKIIYESSKEGWISSQFAKEL